MKIRIIKCNNKNLWYFNQVNEVFNVIDSEKDPNKYLVEHIEPKLFYSVLKQGCVIEQNKENKNMDRADRFIENKTCVKEFVKCDRCGQLMDKFSEDFYTVYGNICLGLSGGLVGDNFAGDEYLVNASIYCKDCFFDILKDIHEHKE